MTTPSIVRPASVLVCIAAFALSACGGGTTVQANVAVPALADLALSSGALSPVFDPATTFYTADGSLLPDTITVAATFADPGSMVTVDGVVVGSGVDSHAIDISEPTNAIHVEVTSATGQVVSYVVVVSRESSRLASLAVSAGSLHPPFHPDVLEYELATPALETHLIQFTPSTQDPAATVSHEGVDIPAGADSPPLETDIETPLRFEIVVTPTSGPERIYGVTWRRRLDETYLKASNVDAGDWYGSAVAVSGDTLVVGAPLEAGDGSSEGNNSVRAAGAVYVYVRTDAGWVQQAYLKASNPGGNTGGLTGGDRFGHSVDIEGDTIVVGAIGESSDGSSELDDSRVNSGAVYVFVRAGGVWTQQAYIKSSDPGGGGMIIGGFGAGDSFGADVAISGDTLVIGAPFEDSDGTTEADDSAEDAGAAFVWTRTGTTWSQQAYLKASNGDIRDQFGQSVGISGDTIVVGAPHEAGDGTDPADNSAVRAGAVYVFTRTGTTWSEVHYMKSSNVEALDEFGFAVDIDGDVIVAGAVNEGGDGSTPDNNDANAAGAAYVFRQIAGDWTEEAYLKHEVPTLGDRFGHSVAVSGDRLVVGAPWESSDGSAPSEEGSERAGAVEVYLWIGTAWTREAYLKASNADPWDTFGVAVDIDGETVAVGAPVEDSDGFPSADDQAPDAGAAYVRR